MSPRPQRTLRRTALALGCGLACAVALPAGASAGLYNVESCRSSAGGSLGSLETRAWTVQRLDVRRSAFDATDGCAAGDAMRGVLRGNRTLSSGEGAQFIFRAPGNTTLRALIFQREIQATPNIAYQLYALVGTRGRAVPLERCFGKGCPTVNARGGVAKLLPNGTRAVVARLSCRPSGDRVCPRTRDRSPFAQLRVTRTIVAVEDIRNPVLVRRPEGPLTSGSAVQSGVRKLDVEASDAGGGLRGLTVVVDGTEVESFPFSAGPDTPCGTVLARRAACPNSARRSFPFDTAKLANGGHELVIRLRDAAGNATDSVPLLISTFNPTSPGVVTRLTAGLGTTSASPRLSTRRLRYGSPATLGGILTDAAGAPIANAPLRITPRIGGPGGEMRASATAVTDASGAYAFPVPVGPSRSFEVRSFTGGQVTAASRADLEVVPPVSLRGTREGRRVVRLRGTVGADPRPPVGLTVQIQALRNGRFVPFRFLRTDPRGSFGLTYRFAGRGRFRLRALVAKQGGFPFAQGRSAVRRFTVR